MTRSPGADDALTEPVPVAHDAASTAVVPPAPRRAGGVGDGLALSLSSALGAAAGFLSWLIAARILPQAQVGQASAVVSAFILVAGCSQLNLGLALMRWLPVAGRRAGWLVSRSLLLIMPLSGLVGLVYVLVVPSLARTAAGANGTFGVGMTVFVLAAAGWGVFVVHDYILVAIGKPWWAVWRNGLFAVVRIGLLVVLGAGLGAQGVILAWVGPIVAWIAVGSVVLAVVVTRFARRADGGTLPTRKEAVGFLGPTATAQLGTSLLLNQVPLLVILRFGPEPGAAFFIAWQAAVVLETAATYFTHSLSASLARSPERGAELFATARRRLLVIFLPLLAIGALLAEPALSIFGPGYAEAADILRLLLLGQAFRLVVLHELGVRTAVGQGLAYARLQLVSTLLVLFVVMGVPGSAGQSTGAALLPVALGYVAVQLGCAVHVAVFRARTVGTARP